MAWSSKIVDDLAAGTGDQAHDNGWSGPILEELHVAVREQHIHATGVERVQLVVGGAVDHAGASSGTAVIGRCPGQVKEGERVGPAAPAAWGGIEHAIHQRAAHGIHLVL